MKKLILSMTFSIVFTLSIALDDDGLPGKHTLPNDSLVDEGLPGKHKPYDTNSKYNV